MPESLQCRWGRREFVQRNESQNFGQSLPRISGRAGERDRHLQLGIQASEGGS
ncbi:hypothetical protein NPIL_27691, partial [Nephila pilipes]